MAYRRNNEEAAERFDFEIRGLQAEETFLVFYIVFPHFPSLFLEVT
jgi:hypothetical protein